MQYLACKTSRSNIKSFKKGMKTYTKKLKMTVPFNVKKLEYTYFHQDYVVRINNNFNVIKRMGNKIVMVHDKKDNILGIQFHPEYILRTGKIFFKCWLNFIKK